MKILIEEYRGFEITFDTESENFEAMAEMYDRRETKKSYSAAKVYVDEYLKANTDFKPFWVQKTGGIYNGVVDELGEKILISGIRKDKRFVYLDKDGKKQQISDWTEGGYIAVDERNAEAELQFADIAAKLKALYAEKKRVGKSVIVKTLAEIKKERGL